MSKLTKNQEILAKSMASLDALLLENNILFDDSSLEPLTKSFTTPARAVMKQRVVVQATPERNKLVKALKAYGAWNQANTIPSLAQHDMVMTTPMVKGFAPVGLSGEDADIVRCTQVRACKNALQEGMRLLQKSNVPALEAVKFQQDVEAALANPAINAGEVHRMMDEAIKARCDAVR